MAVFSSCVSWIWSLIKTTVDDITSALNIELCAEARAAHMYGHVNR